MIASLFGRAGFEAGGPTSNRTALCWPRPAHMMCWLKRTYEVRLCVTQRLLGPRRPTAAMGTQQLYVTVGFQATKSAQTSQLIADISQRSLDFRLAKCTVLARYHPSPVVVGLA